MARAAFFVTIAWGKGRWVFTDCSLGRGLLLELTILALSHNVGGADAHVVERVRPSCAICVSVAIRFWANDWSDVQMHECIRKGL